MMKIIKAESVHIKQAAELAEKEYEMERKACSQLIDKNFKDELEKLVTELFQNPFSYVAVEEGKVIGYIAFWNPKDGFFGNCKGIFSPLGGSAFSGDDRSKLASMLLSHAMSLLTEAGVTSIALSRYAHDEEAGRGFVLNGFGIRCSDAVMNLNKMYDNEKFAEKKEQDGISYGELDKNEFNQLIELRKGLTLHLLQAPTCFPTSLDFFDDLEDRVNNRVFVAMDNEKVIGFIEVTTEEGETFVSEESCMYNICGTYVNPEYRNGDVARSILANVIHTLHKEGVSYLGVDCETINPTALRFWGKNFEAYTYSYHRRIDERVIGYEGYFKSYWEQKIE